ncbi:MAG: DUF1634 domain-containing protein [Hyphomicrobiales bacterium]
MSDRHGDRLMTAVGLVLRAGVLVSFTLVVAGMGVSLFHHPDYWRDPGVLRRLLAPSEGPHTLRDVVENVLAFRGQAIVMLGLLVLIATPVCRVAASVLHFRREGDRDYTLLTSIVLAFLILGFVLGRAGGG